MKRIQLELDTKVYFIESSSFPEGVLDAFQQMYALIGFPPQRRIFGISRPENGAIIYRVAAEELTEGDLSKHGLSEFVIPSGDYIGIEIKDFRKDPSTIKGAFAKLLCVPNIDQNGYCIEEYQGTDAVFCMVRLDHGPIYH